MVLQVVDVIYYYLFLFLGIRLVCQIELFQFQNLALCCAIYYKLKTDPDQEGRLKL